ncbi:hypothetical protein [Chryseobacterium scophthalmum]|uniref:Uncharacterized protein n=1 Tax=Chryseobacterium scophthalmum TaxID=59733 RepID=A0A1N6IEK1_9FLAO|nr:hypothetical protein [Chryseobacterium scophthalmum]SIO30443.1 hypothetical protein SAMN05421769_3378 [Chryseobacterium scophthalmum]
MTKDEFLKLLRKSSKSSYDFAKIYVTNKLPTGFKYSADLNISFDDPTLTEFDIYPEDNGKMINLIDENEVVELLCRKGKVPVWIDISVESVYKNKTIFRLDCAGRYSDEEKEFYYNKQGTGPFGIKSPLLPSIDFNGEKFKLKNNYRKSLFTILKEWFT